MPSITAALIALAVHSAFLGLFYFLVGRCPDSYRRPGRGMFWVLACGALLGAALRLLPHVGAPLTVGYAGIVLASAASALTIAALMGVTAALGVLRIGSWAMGPATALGEPADAAAGGSPARAAPLSPPDGPGPRLPRRALLEATASVLPIAAVTTASRGIFNALKAPVLPTVPMGYGNLHPSLVGLRILQMTDLHLGYGRRARDVEEALERLGRDQFDVVVLTGDVLDDLSELEPTLRAIGALRPRLGAYAVLGNHEYYRGAPDIRRVYDRSDVQLLISGSARVAIGEATLHIAGVDDPAFERKRAWRFYEESVDRALSGAGEQDFRLVLCHRPDAFHIAADAGAHLVLSGHTHGGQIRAFGHTFAEPVMHHAYMLGAFERNGSRLYVSSGFGHWLPVRIGCPAEAPILRLDPLPPQADPRA